MTYLRANLTNRILELSKSPQHLPLLSLRNERDELKNEPRKIKLLTESVPPCTYPNDFISRLGEIEFAHGTVDAVVVGLLVASGVEDAVKISKGYSTFCQVRQQIIDKIWLDSDKDILEILDQLVTPLMQVATRQKSFFVGLENFAANLNGENRKVGSCVVCAALISLLVLSLGGISGELRAVSSDHSFAFSGQTGQDLLAWHIHVKEKGLKKFGQKERSRHLGYFTLSGPFSFISTLLIDRVVPVVGRSYIKGLKDTEALKLLAQLECAGNINPFNKILYRLIGLIYDRIGYENFSAEALEINENFEKVYLQKRKNPYIW